MGNVKTRPKNKGNAGRGTDEPGFCGWANEISLARNSKGKPASMKAISGRDLRSGK